MDTRRCSILAGIALFNIFFLACSSAHGPPEQSRNVLPKSLAGLKMKYSDLHGNYVYTFAHDGTYSWTSTREGEHPEKREGGNYMWSAKSARNAVLDLGDGDIYTFVFNSPTQAKGTIKGDVRTYSFTFAKSR